MTIYTISGQRAISHWKRDCILLDLETINSGLYTNSVYKTLKVPLLGVFKWHLIHVCFPVYFAGIVFTILILADTVFVLIYGSPKVFCQYYDFAAAVFVYTGFGLLIVFVMKYIRDNFPDIYRFFQLWSAARKEKKAQKKEFWHMTPADLEATIKRNEEFKARENKFYDEIMKKDAINSARYLKSTISHEKDSYFGKMLNQIEKDIECGKLNPSRF